jgi:hypothetical protein
VDPRAVLDAVVKRKIPSPRRESNPRTPIVQPKILPIRILIWISFKYILISLNIFITKYMEQSFLRNCFIGVPNSVKMFNSTSLFNES